MMNVDIEGAISWNEYERGSQRQQRWVKLWPAVYRLRQIKYKPKLRVDTRWFFFYLYTWGSLYPFRRRARRWGLHWILKVTLPEKWRGRVPSQFLYYCTTSRRWPGALWDFLVGRE